MSIRSAEILVGVTAGLMIGVGMLVAGTVIGPGSTPSTLAGLSPGPETHTLGACLDTPVTAPAAAVSIGQARLCRDGRSVRVAVQVGGLDPGARYTAWLGYQEPPSGSPGGANQTDAPFAGPMRQIGEGVATTSGRLEVDVSLQGLELASGAQVSLVLLRPGGRAGSHAQAAFVIPEAER